MEIFVESVMMAIYQISDYEGEVGEERKSRLRINY